MMSNYRHFMPLVVMHQMQFHRIVPMLYRVFDRGMEMQLFKQAKVLIEHSHCPYQNAAPSGRVWGNAT